MVYDLTFEEAMDVLQNRIGLVQGEKFNQDEYLSIDRVDKYFIKNVVNDKRLNWWDRFSDQTKEIYTDIKFMPEEMRTLGGIMMLFVRKLPGNINTADS